MTYRTRHMVALKPHTYFGDELAAGDCFYATPVDGGYFLKIGRAADAPEPQPLSAVAAVVGGDYGGARQLGGYGSYIGSALDSAAPDAPATAGEVPHEPEPAAEAPPEAAAPADPDPVVAPRRRGRPPRNAAQD